MWPVYREKGCLSNSQCTFMFPWMQPAAFSRAALHMAPAIQQSGLTAECTAFGVTHDVGLHILNWMASLPDGHPPEADHGTTAGNEDSVAVHGAKRYKGDVTVGGLKGPSGPDGVLRSHVGLHNHYDFEATIRAVPGGQLSRLTASRRGSNPGARARHASALTGASDAATCILAHDGGRRDDSDERLRTAGLLARPAPGRA